MCNTNAEISTSDESSVEEQMMQNPYEPAPMDWGTGPPPPEAGTYYQQLRDGMNPSYMAKHWLTLRIHVPEEGRLALLRCVFRCVGGRAELPPAVVQNDGSIEDIVQAVAHDIETNNMKVFRTPVFGMDSYGVEWQPTAMQSQMLDFLDMIVLYGSRALVFTQVVDLILDTSGCLSKSTFHHFRITAAHLVLRVLSRLVSLLEVTGNLLLASQNQALPLSHEAERVHQAAGRKLKKALGIWRYQMEDAIAAVSLVGLDGWMKLVSAKGGSPIFEEWILTSNDLTQTLLHVLNTHTDSQVLMHTLELLEAMFRTVPPQRPVLHQLFVKLQPKIAKHLTDSSSRLAASAVRALHRPALLWPAELSAHTQRELVSAMFAAQSGLSHAAGQLVVDWLVKENGEIDENFYNNLLDLVEHAEEYKSLHWAEVLAEALSASQEKMACNWAVLGELLTSPTLAGGRRATDLAQLTLHLAFKTATGSALLDLTKTSAFLTDPDSAANKKLEEKRGMITCSLLPKLAEALELHHAHEEALCALVAMPLCFSVSTMKHHRASCTGLAQELLTSLTPLWDKDQTARSARHCAASIALLHEAGIDSEQLDEALHDLKDRVTQKLTTYCQQPYGTSHKQATITLRIVIELSALVVDVADAAEEASLVLQHLLEWPGLHANIKQPKGVSTLVEQSVLACRMLLRRCEKELGTNNETRNLPPTDELRKGHDTRYQKACFNMLKVACMNEASLELRTTCLMYAFDLGEMWPNGLTREDLAEQSKEIARFLSSHVLNCAAHSLSPRGDDERQVVKTLITMHERGNYLPLALQHSLFLNWNKFLKVPDMAPRMEHWLIELIKALEPKNLSTWLLSAFETGYEAVQEEWQEAPQGNIIWHKKMDALKLTVRDTMELLQTNLTPEHMDVLLLHIHYYGPLLAIKLSAHAPTFQEETFFKILEEMVPPEMWEALAEKMKNNAEMAVNQHAVEAWLEVHVNQYLQVLKNFYQLADTAESRRDTTSNQDEDVAADSSDTPPASTPRRQTTTTEDGRYEETPRGRGPPRARRARRR